MGIIYIRRTQRSSNMFHKLKSVKIVWNLGWSWKIFECNYPTGNVQHELEQDDFKYMKRIGTFNNGLSSKCIINLLERVEDHSCNRTSNPVSIWKPWKFLKIRGIKKTSGNKSKFRPHICIIDFLILNITAIGLRKSANLRFCIKTLNIPKNK